MRVYCCIFWLIFGSFGSLGSLRSLGSLIFCLILVRRGRSLACCVVCLILVRRDRSLACCIYCLILLWRGRSLVCCTFCLILVWRGRSLTCWLFCLINLEVACFDFAGGKRTFPIWMPFVRSSFSCLAPRDLVIGCVKRTSRNGIPTFLSINVPQSSPGFVGCFLIAHNCKMPPLRIKFFLSSWG